MFRNSHGGGCCGMNHIFTLPAYSQDADVELEAHINIIKRGRRQGLVELVLIDQQLQQEVEAQQPYGGRTYVMGGWAPCLERLGFQLVSRFQNSNHGNWCNVFHLRYGQPTEVRNKPFNWAVETTVATVAEILPPTQRREIFYSYHNVYRGGRRGAGYDSIEAAAETRGNEGRIDQRVVYSDGTITWNEDI